MSEGVLDLGFCPRCKDVVDGLRGLKSRSVGGVKFCIFCAWHVESDEAELKRHVSWARDYKKNSAVQVFA